MTAKRLLAAFFLLFLMTGFFGELMTSLNVSDTAQAQTRLSDEVDYGGSGKSTGLLILRPIRYGIEKKLDTPGSQVYMLKRMMGDYFSRMFLEKKELRAKYYEDSDENYDAIESALYVKNVKDYKKMAEIVNMDVLRQAAKDGDAALVLLMDIKNVYDTEESQPKLLGNQTQVKKYHVVTMSFLLFDAVKDAVLYDESFIDREMLGKYTYGETDEKIARQYYGGNIAAAADFSKNEEFQKDVDAYIVSLHGRPYARIRGVAGGQMLPAMVAGLGLEKPDSAIKGSSYRDAVILCPSNVNDDVRLVQYLPEIKRFDTGNYLGLGNPIPLNESQGAYIATGDFDGDGSDEIAVSSQYDLKMNSMFNSQKRNMRKEPYIGVYKFNGYQFDTYKPLAIMEKFFVDKKTGASIAAGDFDGDKKDELVVSQSLYRDNVAVYAFEDGKFDMNAPVAKLENVYVTENGWNSGAVVTTGDFNKDGRDELVTAQITGPVYLKMYQFVDGEMQLMTEIKGWENGHKGYVFLGSGDFDGDGTDELIVSTTIGNQDTVKVLSFKDGKFDTDHPFGEVLDQYKIYKDGLYVTGADYDGDGKDDLVLSSSTTANDVRFMRYERGAFLQQPVAGIRDLFLNYKDGVFVTTGRF